MEFNEYLLMRHQLNCGTKQIGEVSSKQYVNRLDNLIKKGIYNSEENITTDMCKRINAIYANKTNEYERTLRYYIEYKKYTGQSLEFVLSTESRH